MTAKGGLTVSCFVAHNQPSNNGAVSATSQSLITICSIKTMKMTSGLLPIASFTPPPPPLFLFWKWLNQQSWNRWDALRDSRDAPANGHQLGWIHTLSVICTSASPRTLLLGCYYSNSDAIYQTKKKLIIERERGGEMGKKWRNGMGEGSSLDARWRTIIYCSSGNKLSRCPG